MRSKELARFRRAALPALALCLLFPTAQPSDAAISVVSDSLLRIMEGRQDDKLLLPGYEYLQADLGTLSGDGFSFHGYGWGRFNFGEQAGPADWMDERAAGEILYGYLEYYRSSYNAFARLGRQNVFSGTSNLSLDGLRVGSDLTPYFAVETWAGLPVALESVRGAAGDRAWGGRVEHHYKSLYSVGLSYQTIRDDGDEQVEVVAIDSSIRPPAPVSITGYSARNLRTDIWQEHSYDARVLVDPYRIGLLYRHFDLDGFLERGVFNSGVLSLQRKLPDKLTQWGGDFVRTLSQPVEVGLRYLRTDRREHGGRGHRFTALGSLHGKGLNQIGGEFGRQFGDNEQTSFWLTRGYFY
ncbi:MAG: hypothetical protein HY900_18020, partial [Deltaproteobacteria bacterium]|nr:hypothetical protein [Deltaproteobacteria bacterium]